MLATIFFQPIGVLNRIGPIAYDLSLPPTMKLHNVFHVLLLKKYVYDSNHVLDWSMIQVEPKGEIQVQPICMLGRRMKILRNMTIVQVNVQ